jgi:hypothetical protein
MQATMISDETTFWRQGIRKLSITGQLHDYPALLKAILDV